MAATAKRTTAIAPAISPHGRRGWVTTCVGGRVRPLVAPLRVADAPFPAADDPPRAGPFFPLFPGVRSLAKASPSNDGAVGPGWRRGPGPLASLGSDPGRTLGARPSGRAHLRARSG